MLLIKYIGKVTLICFVNHRQILLSIYSVDLFLRIAGLSEIIARTIQVFLGHLTVPLIFNVFWDAWDPNYVYFCKPEISFYPIPIINYKP